MLNIPELNAAIARKGLHKKNVAKAIGICPRTFSARLKKGAFGSDEIEKLITLLEIEDPVYIFFCKNSNF